jgi:hypothetical protein
VGSIDLRVPEAPTLDPESFGAGPGRPEPERN